MLVCGCVREEDSRSYTPRCGDKLQPSISNLAQASRITFVAISNGYGRGHFFSFLRPESSIGEQISSPVDVLNKNSTVVRELGALVGIRSY